MEHKRNEVIGSNLALIRRHMKSTQAEFSAKIGVSRAALASYEERRAEPPIYVLIKISDVTGISIDKLVRISIAEALKVIYDSVVKG